MDVNIVNFLSMTIVTAGIIGLIIRITTGK